jgi:hypothetical protein
MVLNPGVTLRLEPADEYMHPAGSEPNYNESMYVNVYDAGSRVGGWFRLGNRPNEGFAEMTVCLYLPGGAVAFMYGQPEITGNDALEAGGLGFHVVEPFERLRVAYQGPVVILSEPRAMADPGQAFRDNPRAACAVALDFRGISPMYGGEQIGADGSSCEEPADEAFARAHYEQHMAASGTIRVGENSWEIAGYGLRDKSWGPRFWQNIWWYRWLPMSFGEDFGAMISIVVMRNGARKVGGMVLTEGRYDLVEEARLESDWDADDCQTSLRAWARTATREYRFEGHVLSLIPLRNRRIDADGEPLITRITEGLTEFHCEGRTGYGMSEYLDQMVDGRPVGLDG